MDEQRERRKAGRPVSERPASGRDGPAEWPTERRKQEKHVMTEWRICGFLLRGRCTGRGTFLTHAPSRNLALGQPPR